MGKLNELPQSMQKCVKSISADLQKIFVDSMSELAAEGGDWSLIGMNDKEKIRAIKRIGKVRHCTKGGMEGYPNEPLPYPQTTYPPIFA